MPFDPNQKLNGRYFSRPNQSGGGLIPPGGGGGIGRHTGGNGGLIGGNPGGGGVGPTRQSGGGVGGSHTGSSSCGGGILQPSGFTMNANRSDGQMSTCGVGFKGGRF